MHLPTDIALAVLAIGVVLLVIRANMGKSRRGGPYRRRYDGPRPDYHRPVSHPAGNVPDAADQLRAVENATYAKQPVLRFQEGKVFAAAEAAVREAGAQWHVFAQVSLGEVLTCPDREGFNAINAKRVDLLITDAKFTPARRDRISGHRPPSEQGRGARRGEEGSAAQGGHRLYRDHPRRRAGGRAPRDRAAGVHACAERGRGDATGGRGTGSIAGTSVDIGQSFVHIASMHAVSYSEARENLKAMIDKVVADRAPIAITRQRGEGAVLISESEWEAIEETLYLLSSPANAKHLMDGIAQLDAGKGEERELIQP